MKLIFACKRLELYNGCTSDQGYGKGNWYLLLTVTLLLSMLPLSLLAVPREMVESLTDENRILTEPLELHLISPDLPLDNSTVSLNHPDAWLFFDNIKPSDVIGTYISRIQVNGVQLEDGVNGRIAIYGHGTVIIPHGSSFTPLTIFSEEGYGGSTRHLGIHIYHNNLGEFDNTIESFKLKRGYMATFANNADGSGYSRVFIADEEDMEISSMPGKLHGTVSFIRVFKYQWVNKKAKAGWNPHDLNCTSYYDWNVGGNSSGDVEYVLIRQNAGWPSWSDINAKKNVSHLLGFNEPDRPDQANMTFQQMIDIWPSMMHSGLRIGAPAWANPWSGNGGNLFDFINKCDELNYRVDFVPLHCYWGGKSPMNWYNDLKHIHEQTGRPLWITEWNNGANWTTEWWPDGDRSYTEANAQKQLNDMMGILQVLDTASFVERYFIYDWVQDCRAMILDGERTLAGEYYAANQSQLAYNKKYEVIPEWNYLKPELSLRYLTLSNSIRLSWIDSNGELTAGYIMEKKVDDGNYESIYSSDEIAVSYFLDTLDTDVGGTISFRLKLLTKEGNTIVSNEVSYYLVAGKDLIQTGSFKVNNSEWGTSLFANKYTDNPMVILGIPSFNNVYPLTQRVNNITTSRFKFQLEPWAYLNDPVMTKTDVISAMTLPSGSYDFGALKAEVKAVPDVGHEWVTVQFENEFPVIPVVFGTIVSNSTASPLVAAVQNVTTTGFELSVKTEEAYKGTVLPETIHYLAIESGKGIIDGKRIIVGYTEEGSGITSMPVELEYDSSYTDPAFFAGLQSAADNFASTVRFNVTGEHKVNIMKHREFSGGISAVKEDKLGWMVLDKSSGQIIDGIGNFSLPSMKLYPNPARNIINLDLDHATRIEIFTVTGIKRLEAEADREIDVSTLPAGIYILKIHGRSPARFIKK